MQVVNLLRAGDGRYPTLEERTAMLDFAERLPDRFLASDEIAKVEEAAIKPALEKLRERYPNFETLHFQAWAKAFRDVQLVVRYCSRGMLFGDKKYADDILLVWLKTMLAGNNFTPGFIRECYELVRESFREHLSPETMAEIEPYLSQTINTMTEFPEPAEPAV